jgi:hypothetical protein
VAKASRRRATSSGVRSRDDAARALVLIPELGPNRRAGVSPAGRRSIPTLDKEDTITNQPNPHDQHDSELQLVLTIGIIGFRELVAWVAEGPTAEDRHARGSTVRRVIDDVVKNVDSAKINQALLDEAARLKNEAQ